MRICSESLTRNCMSRRAVRLRTCHIWQHIGAEWKFPINSRTRITNVSTWGWGPSTKVIAATGAPRVPAPTARPPTTAAPTAPTAALFRKHKAAEDALSPNGSRKFNGLGETQVCSLPDRIRATLNEAQDCQGLTTATPVG